MHSLTLIILSLVLAPGACAIQSGVPKDVGRLKSEADAASGGAQAKLYAQLAEQLVEVANQQFTDGNSVHGQATVQDVLQYAGKAHDIAIRTRNNRKEVEINLRQTQRRLENIRRTLVAEDRPPLEEVEKKLAQLRQDLLDAMFAPKKKKEGP